MRMKCFLDLLTLADVRCSASVGVGATLDKFAGERPGVGNMEEGWLRRFRQNFLQKVAVDFYA